MARGYSNRESAQWARSMMNHSLRLSLSPLLFGLQGVLASSLTGQEVSLGLDASAAASQRAEASDLSVELLGGGSASIRWHTDKPSASRVDFGPTPALGSTRYCVTPTTEHDLTLHGLDFGQRYYFSIEGGQGEGPLFTPDPDSSSGGSGPSGSFFTGFDNSGPAVLAGKAIAWHPLTLSFRGPAASETDSTPNPFLDYRMTLELTGPSGQRYDVPGYFDGDGNGSGIGDTWRARFSPDEGGAWSYVARFREGQDVAISLDPTAGAPSAFDGANGSFLVSPRDPDADGFYRYGRLEYVGEHYLKFRDGPYFLKGGTDSPENFLGYAGFDNTIDQGGASTSGLLNGIHYYAPHIPDFGSQGLGDASDPLFRSEDRGYDSRAIIGALNYLASVNINSIYFLPMNLGGDGQEVYPFLSATGSPYANRHYDISKLSQWQEIFDHATRRGILLHFVLAETEWANEHWLDNGKLGTERKLFYREMIARFGHNLAIKWNLCEETDDYSVNDCIDFADYIQEQDPYDHPIAFHSVTLPANGDNPRWSAVLGDPRFSMTSIQAFGSDANAHVIKWRTDSAASGRKWVIDHDEQNEGLFPHNVDEIRKKTLYDVYFGGGQIEWYAGYFNLPVGGDLRTEDFRQREAMWNYTWYARDFMQTHLPFWEMEPMNGLVTGEDSFFGGAVVFGKTDEVYAIYYPNTTDTGTFDLSQATGDFQLRWYDPTSGQFAPGTRIVEGGTQVLIGKAPYRRGTDWVILISR